MRTPELTMPLFSNEQIPTNAAPMGNTSENSKMMLSPPRSPQLGAGLVKGNNMVQGGGGGVHRPVPTKMSLNQLYGGVGGTTNKARTDPMFLPSADFFPATPISLLPALAKAVDGSEKRARCITFTGLPRPPMANRH